MRLVSALVLLAMVAFAGCGDGNTTSPADMSTPAPLVDMAPYPHECGCVCGHTCQMPD